MIDKMKIEIDALRDENTKLHIKNHKLLVDVNEMETKNLR